MKEGLPSDERTELVRLRRENRTEAMEIEILKRASACVAVGCRVLEVSTSGYF